MLLIHIELNPDRRIPGTLTAIQADATVLSARCLGKSDSLEAARHANPQRNPLKEYGDTPTGGFQIIRIHDMGSAEAHSYGPQPIMDLDGIAGQALEAYKAGRDGIAIHGGALGPAGELRPTFGCIRVYNETQVQLLALVEAVGIANVHVEVAEVDA